MKIGFDIGGVISKYPKQFKELMMSLLGVKDDTPYKSELVNVKHKLYIITDMHPKEKVLQTLIDNGLYSTYRSNGLKQQTKSEYWDAFYGGLIHPDNVYCADYEKYGNMAKAHIIKKLNLDIFIDDFDGYLQWDESFGPQPILLKMQPDAYKPYWHSSWKCDGGDFGRRTYVKGTI